MTIRNKLILYTIGTIIITLILTGMAIDIILTNLYSNNARTGLNHSYIHFNRTLASISNDILAQNSQISLTPSVIAVTNLVQRYQDKNNYQPLIFDNDKKKLAIYLQNKLALSESDRIIIYAKDGSLISYAIQNKNLTVAGIVSYKNGKPVYLNNFDQSNIWLEGNLPSNIPSATSPLNNRSSFLSNSGAISYSSNETGFIIENSRMISRTPTNSGVQLLGVIHTSKTMDHDFFRRIAEQTDVNISLLLHNNSLLNPVKQLLPINNMLSSSLLQGDNYTPDEPLLKNTKYYIQSYVWPTTQGNNYLLLSLPKSGLVTALNQTRVSLLIIFSVIAGFIIITGIYWLNRLISKPLKALVEQTKLDGNSNYPIFSIKKGNDEISKLGTVLNEMVNLIKLREKDLINRTQRLKNAQHLAKIGDWTLDIASDEMQWSDEAYKIFGYDPSNITPSRQAIISIIHPDDLESTEKAYQKALGEKQPFDFVHRIVTSDKTNKYIHITGKNHYDKSGKPVKSTGTLQDVTDQVLKDNLLRRTQKMDALGKLTGGIAHDFNNMLGIIMGFTELLKTSLPESALKHKLYTDEILQAGHRARKLTSKLLNFSRKDTTAATQANINDLLTDERHMLEKTLTVRIQLVLELEKKLWDVWLDKDELEDAIINMAINSMHAIEDEGVLTLSTQNTSLNAIDVMSLNIPAGDYVQLSVTDTGIGMDDETLQQIFEPFFTTKKNKGTGLGMSQVYGFVERCKGCIYVYSEPEHGTRISIYFPRFITEGETLESIHNIEEKQDLTGSARILVVDDEPGLRMLAEEILTSEGYDVISAESGQQALELLKDQHVDLMLSDVIMPGMNGYELAKKVQALYPLIKIQMCSGFSDIKNIDIKNDILHKERLQKPFSANILLQRTKYLLN